MKYIQIESTFNKREESVKLAGLLLDSKLVADGQISEISSVFNFENKHYDRKEWLLTCKTKKSLYNQVEDLIKNNHSFKVPQIMATELKFGSKEYFDWIDENTKTVAAKMNSLEFKIDYNNSQKYISQGEQTQFIFNDQDLLKFKNQIGEIKTDRDLFKIIDFIHSNKQGKVDQQDERKFKRTAKEVFESKAYTGCTDFSIVFATIVRQLGIPAICVEAADCDWIEEVRNGQNNGARGQIGRASCRERV